MIQPMDDYQPYINDWAKYHRVYQKLFLETKVGEVQSSRFIRMLIRSEFVMIVCEAENCDNI